MTCFGSYSMLSQQETLRQLFLTCVSQDFVTKPIQTSSPSSKESDIKSPVGKRADCGAWSKWALRASPLLPLSAAIALTLHFLACKLRPSAVEECWDYDLVCSSIASQASHPRLSKKSLQGEHENILILFCWIGYSYILGCCRYFSLFTWVTPKRC